MIYPPRLKEALYYSRAGLRVMPIHTPNGNGCSCSKGPDCPSIGKHPRINNWQYEATLHRDPIMEWWNTWPDANVGIATGAGSNIIVVDFDPRNGSDETELELIQAGMKFPHTPEVLTGGGGKHMYFRHPGVELANDNKGKLGLGLDVKADGGMVIAPNSKHMTGNDYLWELSSKIGETPMAPAPAWMIERLLDRKMPKFEREVDQGYRIIPEGMRNDTIASIAGKLRHGGFEIDEIIAALHVVNTNRCLPPLKADEVESIAKSMLRYDKDKTFGVTRDSSRFALIWARESFQTLPPVDWIVKDLFSAGSLNLVVGEPGSKKTYAMLDACVSISSGSSWLNFETKACPTLFVDEESGEVRLKRRLKSLLAGHFIEEDEAPPLAAVPMASFDPRDPDDLTHLTLLIYQTEAKLVVIDALADIMVGGDENLVKDVQPVMQALRKIADATGVAIVVIHHTNKQGLYRGSSALKGAVDCLLMVKSAKGETIINFEVEKARDTEPIHFAAEIVFQQGQVWLKPLGSSPDNRLNAAKRFVLRYLDEHGKATSKDLIVNGQQICQPSTMRSNIADLINLGEIENVGDQTKAVYKKRDGPIPM